MKSIHPHRKLSLIAGALYLLTFVSIPTLSLYGPIHNPDYSISTVTDTGVIIGGILEIIVALACIGSAIALYPILKRQNESLALSLVSSRVLEAGTIFMGVMFLLTVVTLHKSSASAESLVISRTLVIMYDRIFLIGQSLMPAVNNLLLGFLLYHSRLVPRSLSLIGIIGSPVLLTGTISVMFGVIGQRELWAAWSALPVALFEFSLGVYLIVNGFKAGRVQLAENNS